MKSCALCLVPALILSLLFSSAACAGTISWTGFSVGVTLSVGNQPYLSRPLFPAYPPGAMINHITWRISLLDPASTAFRIKLCTQFECVDLESLSGKKNIGPLILWRGPLYFVYSANHQGQLTPPINIIKNQLTINWETTDR